MAWDSNPLDSLRAGCATMCIWKKCCHVAMGGVKMEILKLCWIKIIKLDVPNPQIKASACTNSTVVVA